MMLEISVLDNYLKIILGNLNYVCFTEFIVHILHFSPYLKLRFADFIKHMYAYMLDNSTMSVRSSHTHNVRCGKILRQPYRRMSARL